MAHVDKRSRLPAHTPGTPKGEERVGREGPEPGRERQTPHRTTRDATAINTKSRDPIDARMP